MDFERHTEPPHQHRAAMTGESFSSPSPETAPASDAMQLLDRTRCRLREGTDRLARGKIPPAYHRAKSQLERIHHAYKTLSDGRPVIPDHAPARLLANILSQHQPDTDTDLPDFSHELLAELYDVYLRDVTAFADHGVFKSEDVALYHPSQLLDSLRVRYIDLDFIEQSDINQAFKRNRRDPKMALDTLVGDVLQFKEDIEPSLRLEYGFEGSWSLRFVKTVCENSEPEQLARKIFTTMQKLKEAYPQASLTAIETWAKGSIVDQGKRRHLTTEMLKEAPIVEYDESSLERAAFNNQRLREAQKSNRINVMPRPRSANVQRLLKVLDTNWHESFELFDVSRELRWLWFSVQVYNNSLDEHESHLAISTDDTTLYNLLLSFADDIRQLQAEGPPKAAAYVARHHGPGVYEKYIKKYKDEPLLTDTVITTLISRYPASIERHAEEYIVRISHLVKRFGGLVLNDSMRRFAQYSDAEDRVAACLAFAPHAKRRYPWASQHDIERAFMLYANPESNFYEWAAKVEDIRKLYPNDPRFSVLISKTIAKQEGTAVECANNHLVKMQEILGLYGDNPYVTTEYAATWASRPSSYLEAAQSHLQNVEKVAQMLTLEGVEVDHITLRQITFGGNEPELLVKRYLAIRDGLANERDNDDRIEQWMIDQVAGASNTLQFARKKLRWLCYLKSSGVFNVALDKQRFEQGSTFHEYIEDISIHSKPEESYIHQEEQANRRAYVESYLNTLSPLDRAAVELVFGFTSGDKSSLQQELGIEDLDAYVLDEIIPTLKDRA